MHSLCSFHIQIADSLFFPDSGILRICQRTRPPITEPSQIVLVLTKVLRVCFHSEGTMLMVDHIPDHLVDNHFNSPN